MYENGKSRIIVNTSVFMTLVLQYYCKCKDYQITKDRAYTFVVKNVIVSWFIDRQSCLSSDLIILSSILPESYTISFLFFKNSVILMVFPVESEAKQWNHIYQSQSNCLVSFDGGLQRHGEMAFKNHKTHKMNHKAG